MTNSPAAESSPSSALEAFERMFAELDRWWDRLRTPNRPPAGSELASDDADFPWSPASQLAVAGLAAARDHLHGIRLHIRQREVTPFAGGTLTRGALVGASQAVWMLAPDDAAERTKRARMLTVESYTRELQWLRDADGPDAPAAASRVAGRLEQVEELRRNSDQRATFQATEAIRIAAQETYSASHPHVAVDTMRVWRRTSGSAHGLIWSLLYRPGTAIESDSRDEHGVAEHSTGGDLVEAADSYACAHWITMKGWALFDQRSTVTQP